MACGGMACRAARRESKRKRVFYAIDATPRSGADVARV
ncbi:hypothetical protein BRPE64_ACDS06750 [Caballeronia insecticola]|uniref:Uncharacterized protein n=1 Tax=Caballeronia insecticola TaxID=758793 RepID=R4WFS6_9BURK|nr:hypothetical protein BRPE64_ACDS06750 [Caballeronia insecticola]